MNPEKEKVKLLFGDRSDFQVRKEELLKGDGFSGSLKNPTFNGFALSVWNTLETTFTDEDNVDLYVPDMIQLDRNCYNPLTGEILRTGYFGQHDRNKATCICLDGDESYAIIRLAQ